MGGVAGGQKYLHNNIIYKFATDWKRIYGESDEAAMKAASHEMNGLMTVIEVCQCHHNDPVIGKKLDGLLLIIIRLPYVP